MKPGFESIKFNDWACHLNQDSFENFMVVALAPNPTTRFGPEPHQRDNPPGPLIIFPALHGRPSKAKKDLDDGIHF